MYIITLLRNEYNNDCTIGRLYLGSEYFCYTLEDVVRKDGEKIAGKTAIPSGIYGVVLTHSKRFGCLLPEIFNVPNFSAIRIHGGNTAQDTEGCILVAKRHIDSHTIQGSMAIELVQRLSKIDDTAMYINIVNNIRI
jgi:hypothetical protein